jgi:hypothetical protein
MTMTNWNWMKNLMKRMSCCLTKRNCCCYYSMRKKNCYYLMMMKNCYYYSKNWN